MRVMFLGSGPDDLHRPGPALPDAAVVGLDHRVLEVVVLAPAGQDPGVRVLVEEPDETPDPAPSQLVPPAWAPRLSRATDEALERLLTRPRVDVVVTLDRAMLAAAVQLCHDKVRIVHRESGTDPLGLEALTAFAGRCDAVAADSLRTADAVGTATGSMRVHADVVRRAVPEASPREPWEKPTILAPQGTGGVHNLEIGLRAFAMVAAEIPAWQLRVLARRSRHERLARLVDELGLARRVDLVPAREDLSEQLARADLALLMSDSHDDHPLVAMARAARVPVVAADWDTGVRELVAHDRDGLLVRPGSVSGTAHALVSLARDARRRGAMAHAGAVGGEQLTVELATAQWTEVLDRVSAWRGKASRLSRAHERQPPTTTPPRPSPATTRGTLRDLVAVAERSDQAWFALPATPETPLVVVLHSRCLEDFVRHLVHEPSMRDTPVALDPQDRPPTAPTTVAGLTGAPVSHLVLELAGPVAMAGVQVEFWDELGGEWHAPLANAFAPVVRRDSPRAELVVDDVRLPTIRPFDRPTFRDRPFPVDAVYTWVDGNDERWRARHAERLAGLSGGSPFDRTAAGTTRFLPRDELRYSLRSLHHFAPWIRNIHLVTDGQVPSWLREGDDRVRVVDHTKILPASALPTFNSHAIETALHRIEGLSESFLYFNDDMLLGAEVGPESFFGVSGDPKVFFSRGVVGVELDDLPAFQGAALNNRALLEHDFGLTVTNVLQHAPAPLRRSLLGRLEERYPDEFRRTAHAPFRSPTDLSLTSSLVQHFGLATGGAEVGEVSHRYVDVGSPHLARALRGLSRRRDVQTFCLGDAHFLALGEDEVAQLLTEFLEGYFPGAAPWENDRS